MDNLRERIAIQQELEPISDRLRKMFGQTHPQFDSVLEDVGAAGIIFVKLVIVRNQLSKLWIDCGSCLTDHRF